MIIRSILYILKIKLSTKAWNDIIESLDLKVAKIKVNALLQKNGEFITNTFFQSNSFPTHFRVKHLT